MSLFSGIGGFELGIKEAIPGAECVGYSEIDQYAIKIYQKHFPHHKNYGDITKINPEELPSFELLVGGFPCQAFSIAGKRAGFLDTRGTLFFEIARILKQRQPRLLLLENVKGLLSHDNGKTFYTIIATLDELGYDCQWQVLNSKHFGVPQSRERIYIVGHLRGTTRPQVFPLRGTAEIPFGSRGEEGEEIATTLRAKQGGPDCDETYIYQLPHGFNDGGLHKVAPTLSAGAWQYNHTLFDKGNVRRLTMLEWERLQAFPDGWTDGFSDTRSRERCPHRMRLCTCTF